MKNFCLIVAMTIALAGCALSPDTESAIRDTIAANAGHMGDESLPKPAREIATVNHDLLWDVLFREGAEDELPADVRERKAARAGGAQ
jgi:hypothetical protein